MARRRLIGIAAVSRCVGEKLHVRSADLDGFLNKARKTRLSANEPQDRHSR